MTTPDPVEADLRPHGGKVVMLLGVLGLLGCLPGGVIAWIIASNELAGMQDGRIDPSGRRQVELGRTLGIIGVILSIGYFAYRLAVAS